MGQGLNVFFKIRKSLGSGGKKKLKRHSFCGLRKPEKNVGKIDSRPDSVQAGAADRQVVVELRAKLDVHFGAISGTANHGSPSWLPVDTPSSRKRFGRPGEFLTSQRDMPNMVEGHFLTSSYLNRESGMQIIVK